MSGLSGEDLDVAAVLGSVPLFAALPDAELAAVAAIAEVRSACADEVLFREGDAGDSLFVLARGRVVVERESGGALLALAEIGPGQFFGEMALLDDTRRSATVRVHSESAVLLELARQPFGELVRQRGEIAMHLIACLSRRIRDTNDRVLEIDRVAKALVPDLAEIVEEQYPHPIALVAQELAFAPDAGTKLRRIFELTETVLVFQAALCRALYLESGEADAETDALVLRAGTLGTLQRFVRLVLERLVDGRGPSAGLAADLHAAHERYRSHGNAVESALSEVIAARNAVKHGSEAALDDHACQELVDELAPKATTLLRSLDCLRRYELVHVQSMGYRDGAFDYTVLECRGAFRSFRSTSFEHPEPLETQRMYLRDPRTERPLPLHPWMGLYRCEVCGDRDVFLAQKWSPREVSVIELGRGHRMAIREPGRGVAQLFERLSARLEGTRFAER